MEKTSEHLQTNSTVHMGASMTVIVWDGKSLTTDKQATQSDLMRTVTKSRIIRGHLCAVAGDWDLAQEMFVWFERGAKPDEVPPFFRSKEDWVAFVAITPDKRVLKFERSPYPMDFTETVENDGWFVFGSGRDFAVGALAMGASPEEAVRIASKYCTTCGNGVDVLHLPKKRRAKK
jgi:hypothetical protein